MALTPEQEKFVVDLFTIAQKQQQINAFADQRQTDEQALVVQFKVNEANTARSQLVTDFQNNTAQLRQDIDTLQKQLTK